MFEKYRVICTENQKLYPDKLFIDIYPAGIGSAANSLTHECLLQMRRMINPEVEVVETGILLTDLGNGNLQLQYEKMPNRRMQQYQDNLRKQLDKKITDAYKDMRLQNKDRTMEVSLSNMVVLFDLNAGDDTPVSAREDALIKENARQKYIVEKRKHLLQRKASNKYASKPHTLLAWKQAMIRGD